MQLVTFAAKNIVRLYPPSVRAELEPALPALILDASQLAIEVMRAEGEGILFANAARQIRFPLLSRVHFGVEDLLQRRLPKPLRQGVRTIFRQAAGGDFEPLRRAFFTEAARRGDPQAALLRFLLYEAVRFNLLVATWDDPAVEALGCLDRIEREAQGVLDELLAVEELHDDEVRPLHVVVAEFFVRTLRDAEETKFAVLRSAEAMDAFQDLIEETTFVRALYAHDAAVARADVGSQRLADRFPDHFPSANAVDLRRSRLRRAVSLGEPPVATRRDRFVDVLRDAAEEEESTR